MRTDKEIQKAIQNGLSSGTLIHAAEIGVSVKNGIATLSGSADSYAKKIACENAARKVEGVTALVEKIKVKLPMTHLRDDGDLATEVLNILKTTWKVPNDILQIKVEGGCVTLEGEREWKAQKAAIAEALKNVSGIKGLVNNIKIESGAQDKVDKEGIGKALSKINSINGSEIKVRISGMTITLHGKVHSIYESEEAERIAWNVPGIWQVINELVINKDETGIQEI